MKTNKSYSKRIKVTRTGKLIARKPGQDHYNGAASGGERRGNRGTQELTVTTRVRRRFLAVK